MIASAARGRCKTCTHEYGLAFSCKARYFCPSCHAKRLALRTLWLEDADARLAWPHSGFHVHDEVWVPDGDMEFAKRLARYCARNPVALERLQHDGPAAPVQYRPDNRDGPTAGTDTAVR